MNKITIGITYIKLTRSGRTYLELRMPGTNPNMQVERLVRQANKIEQAGYPDGTESFWPWNRGVES